MRIPKVAVLLFSIVASQVHADVGADLSVICTSPNVKEGALVSDNVCKGFEKFDNPRVNDLVRSTTSDVDANWTWRKFKTLAPTHWVHVCAATLERGSTIPAIGKSPCLSYQSLTRDNVEYVTPVGPVQVVFSWPAVTRWPVSQFHTGEPLPPRVIYKVYGGPRGFIKHELASVLNKTTVTLTNQPSGEMCYVVTASAREFEPTSEEWAQENFEPANDFESPPSPENCHQNRIAAPTDGSLE
jgi:hypothetical protein